MSFGLGFGFPGTVAAGSGATLALQFAGATALDPRITFTRASSATFTNSAGLVASAATNVPRLDYDPVTLQPKGLLIEEARTNLLTYSEQFDNTAIWPQALGTTVTANTTVAPDGTLTADTINFTTSAGNRIDQFSTTTAVAGTSYTFSVWLKGSGTINIVSTEAGGTPASEQTVTLTSTWTRYTATYTAIASGALLRVMIIWRATNTATSCQAWGAQLEAGAFATSYIPTVAAQATRAAENAVMTGTNFSSWYNATEGTLYTEGARFGSNLYPRFAGMFNAGSESNSIGIGQWTPQNRVDGYIVVSGTPVGTLSQTITGAVYGTLIKAALGYQENNTAFAANGSTAAVDTSLTIPVVDQLRLGFNEGPSYLNGHIKRITYWPRRLSNAELQAVTS